MKPLLLTLSLTANVVLATGLAFQALSPRASRTTAPSATKTNSGPPKAVSSSSAAPAVSPSAKVSLPAGSWLSPAGVQARLLSSNAPLEVRYAIAQAMFDQKYQPARNAARFPTGTKRWQHRHPKPGQIEQESAIRRQQEMEMEQLLGADYARGRAGGQDTMAKSGITPEGWLQINRITRDYAETSRTLGGSQARAERQLLNTEMLADIAKALTPQEFEQYNAYFSQDASRLQRAMMGLDVDDETYLRAFQAMAAVKTTAPSTGSPVSLWPAEIQAIEKAAGPEVATHITRNQGRMFRAPSSPPQESQPAR